VSIAFPRRLRAALLGAIALPLGACASAGRIAEYDFRDRTVAVVAVIPPRPYVDTDDDVDLDGLDPVGVLLKVGTAIYKESQAERLRARLDSASTGLDLSDRIAGGVLERSARLLGGTAVETSRDADFHLEVHVQEYGVDARQWDDRARFRIRARMLLLDRDGREIWKGTVDEDEAVDAGWFDAGSAAADILTGSALGRLTVGELAELLNDIADHSAYRLTEKLRAGIEKARGD
jgi:hypothetical protein